MPALARAPRDPEVPDAIKPPAGERLVLQLHASGSQVYVCKRADDGAYLWTLKAPEAELRDLQGAIVGRHFAGPAWRLNDGSEVVGKLVTRVDAPDTRSIPWLLITVSARSGQGLLSRVTSIQRIHTQGGLPPAAGCGEAQQNAEMKVPYTADYYFYAPAV
jgi:uncharacterized protein DUF3455